MASAIEEGIFILFHLKLNSLMCLVATLSDSRVWDSYTPLLFRTSTWVLPGRLRPNGAPTNSACRLPNPDPHVSIHRVRKPNHPAAQGKALTSTSPLLFPSLPTFTSSADSSASASKTFPVSIHFPQAQGTPGPGQLFLSPGPQRKPLRSLSVSTLGSLHSFFRMAARRINKL